MLDLEQKIRERAYQLWLEGGQQEGKADTHWLEAQRETLATSLALVARVATSKSAASRKKRRAA